MVSVQNALPYLQAGTTAVRDAQSQQHHKEIMEWLSQTDFPAQQHGIISRRQEGTVQWLLNSTEFKRWLQGLDTTLFCPGIPGAGKTMVAATAVEYLYRTASNDDVGIACLFCSYKAQIDQSAPNLFAAVLKQLVRFRPDIAAPVSRMHEELSKRGNKPSLDDLTQALYSVCSSYSTVYIVIDALDECSNVNGVRRQLIDKMRDIQGSGNVRLLFTSRHIPDVTQDFKANPWLEVRASEKDVRSFIAGQVSHLPNCIRRDEALQKVVQTKIVEAVDGM
jgi:Cdc6-like AAA superfamily ATPase